MRRAPQLLRPLGISLAAGAAFAVLGAIAAVAPYAREPWRLPGLAAAARGGDDVGAALRLRLLCALGSTEAHRAAGEAWLGGTRSAEALGHLREAARRGDGASRLLLGKALLLGAGSVRPEPVEAARWLRLGAEGGDVRAAYWLGVLHRSDLGGRDDAAAVPWLERAAAGGLPAAQYLLGTAYRDGRGVAPDAARAVALLEAAAEAEHPEALQALAMAHATGALGVPRDPARTRELLAELEHAVRHPPMIP